MSVPAYSMDSSRWTPGSSVFAAMLGSALVGGQFIAGKAARDALFLSHFEASMLPPMIIATAVFSILLVIAGSRALAHTAPTDWVPGAFGLTAILALALWVVAPFAPALAARTLYLLVSGVGPLLASGFWLIVTERFDPHTARKTFGRIAAAGTLGGLLAALIAAGVAVTVGVRAMLPLLAVLNLACFWCTRQLVSPSGTVRTDAPSGTPAAAPRSAFRILAGTHYLRNLAVLVLVGTIAATFVDLVFKTHVKAELGSQNLGGFFSLYYASLSLITLAIQTGAARFVLEKLGLGAAAATPSVIFLLGGGAALLFPDVRSLALTRGSEAVFRASIFRPGYELFYTPVAPEDRRAVKSLIDVGVDRTGDIVGAAIAQPLLQIPQPAQTTVLLWLAMGCAAVGLIVSSRLTRGYAESLASSLRRRTLELDLSDTQDLTTRTTMMRTLRESLQTRASVDTPADGVSGHHGEPPAPAADADVEQIVALRSGDRARILRVLRGENGLLPSAVPHVIALLGRDDVSRDCISALRGVAEERVGELIDALTNPNQPFVVRRRLARVFSVCVSQRAVDGLLLGLEDLRFEVRYQCGRSLLAIVDRNPAVHLDRARIFALLHKEVAVNKHVWDKRQLLDTADDTESHSFLEDLVRERVNHSLAHVFTLLALVLPAEPLRLAFRGLHTDDEQLRGTALEYLESVLPREIRDELWRFLEDRRAPGTVTRPRADVLADLLRSHPSIRLNLEQLQQRQADRAVRHPDADQ